ncbi:nucleoside-diphosphate kinase [Sedimentisphaera salicampi]|uniref:Nucleoside diphosphate kinase n=1 Tax=Sedimentisphaera salicampi TaxID=1941349 RepID=A0A1W6LMT5_9BACT|nr:nucleoside-diphosphate kinase [Sedimentisphaera salicampi]ARN57053.1 Nucleoside diphosphate kinase [Sedimentisphaera salicampi]OXU14892.1 Nucleoside diphosphate kinase [Sedimentisphaera salicampi]
MQKSLIIIKPDAVQRGLCGDIIKRFENKGLKLAASKFMLVSRETAEKHYAVHKDKPFYEKVCKYLASSPVLVMVWRGKDAVELARRVIGATSPFEASPGTIRGDFSLSKTCNLVHGSDSVETAKYEIPLFFSEEEVLSYDLCTDDWLDE